MTDSKRNWLIESAIIFCKLLSIILSSILSASFCADADDNNDGHDAHYHHNDSHHHHHAALSSKSYVILSPLPVPKCQTGKSFQYPILNASNSILSINLV